MRRARVARGLVAGALLGGLALASAPPAAAEEGTAYVLSDVQCDGNGNGVLDLTLINDHAAQAAVFVVADVRTGAPATYTVSALSASAVTFTDLADGSVSVPVTVDGADAAVAVQVACDAPKVEALPTPARRVRADRALPRTGSSTGGLVIGGLLVAAGIAASLASRRRYS